MPLATDIAPHLPSLRRFARLLTGSQEAGDASVARILQAIAADPATFPDLPIRLGLYQGFLTLATRRYQGAGGEAGIIGDTAVRSLGALSPEVRQAFLLTAVEEFSQKDAAVIMQVSQARIAELLQSAGAEIGTQIATDVLIIEDEPLIALDLKRVLEDLGHRVMAIAPTHRSAIKAAASKQPGLVIADIRLADGSSGIEAVNEILASFSVPVVFVTAYPEHLSTGTRPEPAFVLSKPFREEAVKAVISQVLFFDQRAAPRSPRGRS